MLTNAKLSEAQLSKIIQSRRFIGAFSSKFAVPLMKIAVPLAKNVLAPLITMTSAFAIEGGH